MQQKKGSPCARSRATGPGHKRAAQAPLIAGRSSLVTRLYEDLREAIVSVKLAPGTMLSEESVSTPGREPVRRFGPRSTASSGRDWSRRPRSGQRDVSLSPL